MADVTRFRLVELLQLAISRLEGFLSSDRRHPLRIAELEAVADYLGTRGLKPDGDWLLRQHDIIYKQGYALVESEVWAVNPEGARSWGYSPRFSSETDEDRRGRRDRIRYECQKLLDHLRRLLQIVSNDQLEKANRPDANSDAHTTAEPDDKRKVKEKSAGPDAKLPPSREKAFRQYLDAVAKEPNRLTGASDSEVYSSVKENLEAGEGLPNFATWSRYLREAREFYSAQKNTPRSGRPTGKSVVREDQIDPVDCD